MIKLIECPRDAMQGIKTFIPTDKKTRYLQSLLNCNFDVLDIGSFVSPKAIPQMRDTAEVLDALDFSNTTTELSVIVANIRGAKEACSFEQIKYLGFPFSISEIFQMRNTHKTIEESFALLDSIQGLCNSSNKELVVYLSMGFGNPYGDPWNVSVVFHWIEQLAQKGIRIISLSDTMGNAEPSDIAEVFLALIAYYKQIEFGAHFHCAPLAWKQKLEAAYKAGCKRFDTAIQGFGGCPMASNELVGNLPTEKAISFFTAHKARTNIDMFAFEAAVNQAKLLFSQYA
ncbi:MAG: hydroxymethylglutaryl-CoA lyase [Flavobacteriaceae bacterium]